MDRIPGEGRDTNVGGLILATNFHLWKEPSGPLASDIGWNTTNQI